MKPLLVRKPVRHSDWTDPVIVIAGIELFHLPHLFQHPSAAGASGFTPGTVQRRKKHARKDRNDCNCYKEFYKGKHVPRFSCMTPVQTLFYMDFHTLFSFPVEFFSDTPPLYNIIL